MESILPILDHMPIGFRFRPTDEELVNYYLKHKLLDDDFPVYIIPEIDLCKVEPWDVPARSVIKSHDPEWFFFSPVDYKYLKSKRFNRTTKRGFWKATGNDRNIRTTGTNNVIGTKKTLVFHEGRVPRGAKTNWVIHEYHAISPHESQRTFVLCRLMKKAEKKNEGGIEAPTFDEGEPSMVSDYVKRARAEGIPSVEIFPGTDMDEIFQAVDQAEKLFPPAQQSQIGIELDEFFPKSPSLNACFRNENINMQTPFEVTDEEDELVNSFWVDDEEFVINEERRHCFVNSSTQPKSLRRVYNANSDIDAEVVSNLHDSISSGEYPASKMVKSSYDSFPVGTSCLASSHEANKEKKESIIQDNFWAVETSSVESTADEPLELNSIEISSSSSPTRLKNQYHLRPGNFILQRTVAGRPQTQKREVSTNAVSHVEARKELLNVKSEKDQKNAQNTTSRGKFKSRSPQSSDFNNSGSFFYMERTSNHLFPRSVYLVNVVIGILLLIVISWDVLTC
ncbi:hypothetical protein VNO78_25000 [Psophocarpus tetragonolobus]|uniref:NAC domain-containing protein n=1 Tax=Psophocarpus tetragonolobus TaxID=3891 RepID=A0AAN9S6B0_PSOTE